MTLEKRVYKIEKKLREIIRKMTNLNSDVTKLDTDEQAMEKRVEAHEAMQEQTAKDLQAQIDALKAAGTVDPATITELESIQQRVENFDPDSNPVA